MTFNAIFEIILQIVLLIIGGLLIPLIKQRIGEAKYYKILDAVEVGVTAAEQIYKSIPKSEERNKLRYGYVVDLLNSKEIKLTERELKALIEGAVLRLNETVTK